MKKDSLDKYDILPEAMLDYLSNYGRHFNRKLLKFALSGMKHVESSKGELSKITPFSKEEVEAILKENKITLENNQLYDHVYVANMCKADFLGDSIPDNAHLAKYVKNVIDDPDGYDGIVFNRWYVDTRAKGIAIDWDAML